MSTEPYKQETYKLPVDSKSLLDQLAEKDSRMTQLEKQLGVRDGETLEQRAAALMLSHQATYQPLKNRIAQLEACLKKELDMAEEWQAMYALLEQVPHNYRDDRRQGVPTCHPNCPACAWAKLKEGK